jgi:hypothetical protein
MKTSIIFPLDDAVSHQVRTTAPTCCKVIDEIHLGQRYITHLRKDGKDNASNPQDVIVLNE